MTGGWQLSLYLLHRAHTHAISHTLPLLFQIHGTECMPMRARQTSPVSLLFFSLHVPVSTDAYMSSRFIQFFDPFIVRGTSWDIFGYHFQRIRVKQSSTVVLETVSENSLEHINITWPK